MANAAPLSNPNTIHSTNNGTSAMKAPTGANAQTSIMNACTATATAATVEIADAATAAAIELTADAEAIRDSPTTRYPRDRLDVHVEKAIAAFKVSTSWASFITSVRGRGDLHPGVKELPHPAAYLLSRFQKSGTPAMMKTAQWSAERIDDALKRCYHQSSHRGIEFL